MKSAILVALLFQTATPTVCILPVDNIRQEYSWITGKYETTGKAEPMEKLTAFLQWACEECQIITKAEKADFLLKISGTSGAYQWSLVDNRGDGKIVASGPRGFRSSIFRLEKVMEAATKVIREAAPPEEEP